MPILLFRRHAARLAAAIPHLALEDRLIPVLGPAMAFRLLVVLERTQ
jgi:hypothetical protein